MPVALSLLSWNLHGVPFVTIRRERFGRVAARVIDSAPDVVLFQEVWLHRDARQLKRALHAHYEPIPAPIRSRPLRTSGLLSFVRRDNGWALKDSQFHRFAQKAPAWKFWEGDGLGRKGVHEIHFERDGVRLLVLNTHLQAAYPWNDYEPIRRPQLAQLCELMQRLDRRWPVIASGDLNTRPSEDLYRDLLANWFDLTAHMREQRGRGTYLDRAGAHGDWIDYILARRHDSWDVHAEDIVLIENTHPDVPYSDHHGLHARLRIQPR